MTQSHVLPLIDISMLASSQLNDRLSVVRELDRACAGSGFLYIRGSQLDGALFRRLVARAKAYFALDPVAKMKSYIGNSENHSGYVPVGEEQFGTGVPDLKEAFDVNCDYISAEGRRPLLGPNLWPEMRGFRRMCNPITSMSQALGVNCSGHSRWRWALMKIISRPI